MIGEKLCAKIAKIQLKTKYVYSVHVQIQEIINRGQCPRTANRGHVDSRGQYTKKNG